MKDTDISKDKLEELHSLKKLLSVMYYERTKK